MKKILYILILVYSFPVIAQVESILPDAPRPAKLYNDLTKGKNFITPEQAAYLENKLVAYDDSTSNQVAIVVVESLEGYSANEYGTKLGRKWGVGGKDNNNGIVVLISTEPGNRDAYIAVGYGLEGVIPDVTAKRIVEYVLIPAFKNGDFFRGLDNTINAIIKAAAGEYTAPEGYNKRKGKGLTVAEIIIMIIVIMIVLGVIGGGRGGGGYASRRGWGGPGWGGGWSGGSWGGGGWSGGSSGGGGFGGFGGGSFGGGGAGGKW